MMSTLVSIDPNISTQADGAQSSRVPVPFPKDPYEAIRQAYLVETETLESPHTIASPTPLPDSTPPMSHAEDSVDSETSGARSTPSDSTAPLSPDHPLTHASPTLVPILRRTARMVVRVPPAMSHGLSTSIAKVATMSDLAFLEDDKEEDDEEEDDEEEDEEIKEISDSDNENKGAEDEGGDAAIPEGQQRAALVVKTAMGEPLGLGYEALRCWEIALGEGRMPSVFEPTLTTWIDLEDGIAYIDVLAYPPPALQTSLSLEWSSGSLLISPAPSIIPLPISSPMIPLTVPLLVASPATTETERFLTELGARVEMQGGLIRDHTIRLGSLEHDQERVVVTFRAIWIPVLALESWAGQTDAQREALWHAISDTQRENHELRLQIVKERRAWLDLDEIIDKEKNKDGSFRMCIDYRELNKLIVQNVYPHLGLDDQYEKLQNGPHFPQKIDLRSGYHQLRVHEDDILKTTFRTRYEHFEFTVMPFSMTNAPATTLDSRGALEHLRIHVDPSKIEAVKNWKAPITLFEVRSFLLLAGYYCRFIENFSKIAKSLTILTHKCKTFDWGEEQKNAFQTLKDKVVTAHHLKIHEKNYTTHDLKQGAVVFALKIWRHYLKGLKRQKEAKTIEQSDKKNGKRQRVRARVRNPPGSKPDQPDTVKERKMKSRVKIKSKGPRMPSIQRFKG
ncbi:hypothetical protein Tco_0990653 [Tanacetum coccineum]|uniref:Reverse transcriptase domain-containing protein n=1 Tax=Tanacetum coccineum TaxID=301880 RepID=A0ABQ5EXR8_9ASTR